MERKLAPIFYKALAQTVAPVLISLNPDSILQAPWIDAYKRAYSLLTVFAKQEYLQLQSENPTKAEISFFDEQWRLIMSKYGNDIAWDFATDLNETTINQIRKAIADGSLDYATNSQLARLIREYTLGDIGKVRSLLIARTETTTGANKAKEIAARSYFDEIGEDSGYKLWITRMDGNERHDHAIVNNTAVPFDDEFNVGGFDANLPGDPKLPAKERVRCRCTFVSLTERGYQKRIKEGTIKIPQPKIEKVTTTKLNIIEEESYKKINSSADELIKRRLSELIEEYPNAKLKRLGGSTISQSSIAEASVGGGMSFNPKYFNNLTKFEESIKKQSSVNHFYKGANVDGIIDHEFGHILTSEQLPSRGITDFKTDLTNIFEEYKKSINDSTRLGIRYSENPNFISKYSHTSLREFAAESFAFAKKGESASPYAKKVLNLIDKYFK